MSDIFKAYLCAGDEWRPVNAMTEAGGQAGEARWKPEHESWL